MDYILTVAIAGSLGLCAAIISLYCYYGINRDPAITMANARVIIGDVSTDVT